MKKLCLILLPFLFLSCQNNISYELRNKTSYNVILIDMQDYSYSEYAIEANTTITIKHTTDGKFKLKDNTYPIEVYDGFIYTEIRDLVNRSLIIHNNTDKTFTLKIQNTTHSSTSSFSIAPDSHDAIKIYINENPVIELYYNETLYTNYILNNDSLIIL